MMLNYLNTMEEQLIAALLQLSVRFAVVGGHAVLCYSPIERKDSAPRFPGDLDILVGTEQQNLIQLSEALARLNIHFAVEQLEKAFFENRLPNLVGGYGAQLFPRILGVDSEAILSTVSYAQTQFGRVPVISKPLLIEAKRACDRPKDIEDLRALLAVNTAA